MNSLLPNICNIKYGIRFLSNAKEAAQFDKDNSNTLWENSSLKDLEALISMNIFKKLQYSLRKSIAGGYQFAPLRMILDVRVDLGRKSILIIGCHAVD